MNNEPFDPMADVYRRAAEVQAARKAKEDQREGFASFSLAPLETVAPIEGGGPACDYPGIPPAYAIYADGLVRAIQYLVKNNAGVAKVPLAGFKVSTLHLRNSLRVVRNLMMANPPMGYAIINLTFVAIADGVIVRDKRRSEPFKVTAPIAKVDAAAPLVASSELIGALAIVLGATDSAGVPASWPDFVLETDSENVSTFLDQIKSSFPPFWKATASSYYIEVCRTT